MNCLNCNKETENPKFCCRSCATTFNNRLSPKRKPEGSCKDCGKIILASRSYCTVCFNNKVSVDFTLEEAKHTLHGSSSKFALVRTRARKLCENRPQECVLCGYTKHVEVCHVQPISSFPESTKLSEVNREDNLVLLCRNCHWELDHGLTNLSN